MKPFTLIAWEILIKKMPKIFISEIKSKSVKSATLCKYQIVYQEIVDYLLYTVSASLTKTGIWSLLTVLS